MRMRRTCPGSCLGRLADWDPRGAAEKAAWDRLRNRWASEGRRQGRLSRQMRRDIFGPELGPLAN